jgi:hypothetical protein
VEKLENNPPFMDDESRAIHPFEHNEDPTFWTSLGGQNLCHDPTLMLPWRLPMVRSMYHSRSDVDP